MQVSLYSRSLGSPASLLSHTATHRRTIGFPTAVWAEKTDTDTDTDDDVIPSIPAATAELDVRSAASAS